MKLKPIDPVFIYIVNNTVRVDVHVFTIYCLMNSNYS